MIPPCERCGKTFRDVRARTSHVNAKGKRQCRSQAEQQPTQQTAPQSSTQVEVQEGTQNNLQQVKTTQRARSRVQKTVKQQNIPLVVQGNMCKKCKDPIVEKKYVSIGTQTDFIGEMPLPRKNVELQDKEIITSAELGQNLIQIAPKKRETENTKLFLIYKKISNSVYDFYDGKTKWNGSNNTFSESSHQYLFIPVKRNETLEEAYTVLQ